jgi:hypothetical protein
LKITSKKYGELEFPESLSQDQLEKYYQTIHDITEAEKKDWRSSAEFRRVVCMAAVKMGWIKGPDWNDARSVTWTGNSIITYVSGFEVVSPN